jgi:hypothetical protein
MIVRTKINKKPRIANIKNAPKKINDTKIIPEDIVKSEKEPKYKPYRKSYSEEKNINNQ